MERWHGLGLRMEGRKVSAFIDGKLVASLSNIASFDHGLVGLGSSWNTAWCVQVGIVG